MIMGFLMWLVVAGSSVQLEPVVLVRGVVRNSGQPEQVEILFRDETGKSVRVRSAADGSYQAVLAPGRKYAVTVVRENLERYTFAYTTPPSRTYVELAQDFTLNPPSSSQTLMPATTTSSSKKVSPSKKGKRKK
ncbi:MAG: hypothetical protein RMK00_03690 [Bacteroidota bacterium]|nr:hypothetical protein [Candidatus Kapabacteria bacterium]MCS7302239.1 hypothetical protein [Candidatus Kapabacteria bacterium]MDW8074859.1 hypothetical protein [Bacteroidota bacterium]